MAITASTSGTNRIVQADTGRTLFDSGKKVVASTTTFKQGDLMYFDTSNHIIAVVAATGNAATFVGIADNSVTSGKLVGPYDGLTSVDTASVGPDFVGPKHGVVAAIKLKASDAFNPGDKVYLVNGGDSQTVTSSDPGDGNYIGVFVDSAVSSAASGQTGKVKIGCRYPAATGTGLSF